MSKLYALYRAGRRAVGLGSRPVAPAYQAGSRVDLAPAGHVDLYLGDGVLCDALR